MENICHSVRARCHMAGCGWEGKKSRKPADQWMHRNKDTVPKNMLQFGWPNVCSVCMSQIQNKFSHFMNNSTESNWSGHCNTWLKIDTQDRHFSVDHELLHDGYYYTGNHCFRHTELKQQLGYRVSCSLEYLGPRWEVRQWSTASCQNFLPDTWIVEKVCLLHRHAASRQKQECVCFSRFPFPPSRCVLLTFWLAWWQESWLVCCSLTDGRIRQGLEMATLIWGANPLPTTVIGAGNPCRREQREVGLTTESCGWERLRWVWNKDRSGRRTLQWCPKDAAVHQMGARVCTESSHPTLTSN